MQESKFELDTQSFDMDSDFDDSRRSSSRASLVHPYKQTWGEQTPDDMSADESPIIKTRTISKESPFQVVR